MFQIMGALKNIHSIIIFHFIYKILLICEEKPMKFVHLKRLYNIQICQKWEGHEFAKQNLDSFGRSSMPPSVKSWIRPCIKIKRGHFTKKNADQISIFQYLIILYCQFYLTAFYFNYIFNLHVKVLIKTLGFYRCVSSVHVCPFSKQVFVVLFSYAV